MAITSITTSINNILNTIIKTDIPINTNNIDEILLLRKEITTIKHSLDILYNKLDIIRNDVNNKLLKVCNHKWSRDDCDYGSGRTIYCCDTCGCYK